VNTVCGKAHVSVASAAVNVSLDGGQCVADPQGFAVSAGTAVLPKTGATDDPEQQTVQSRLQYVAAIVVKGTGGKPQGLVMATDRGPSTVGTISDPAKVSNDTAGSGTIKATARDGSAITVTYSCT